MTDNKQDPNAKPLDKMTVTELREVAKDLPDITGVHGMKKAELLAAIKEAKGITDEAPKKTGKPVAKIALSVKELKAQIKEMRSRRAQALAEDNRKMAKIYRRRISRLKKKTRQAA